MLCNLRATVCFCCSVVLDVGVLGRRLSRVLEVLMTFDNSSWICLCVCCVFTCMFASECMRMFLCGHVGKKCVCIHANLLACLRARACACVSTFVISVVGIMVG